MKLQLTFLLICTIASAEVLQDFGDDIESSFIKQINKIDEQENVDVIKNFVVLHKNTEKQEQGRQNEGILDRISRFISSHDLKIKMPTTLNAAKKFIAEARGSKLKKFIVPFIVLMILKKSIEVPIFLAVVSLVAFKGLGAGLISLVLSAATAFKSLLEHHSSSKVSYEVIPHSPHWSRSDNEDYPNFGYHTITK